METMLEYDVKHLLTEIELEEEISRLREEVWKLRVKNKRLEYLVADLREELDNDKKASYLKVF